MKKPVIPILLMALSFSASSQDPFARAYLHEPWSPAGLEGDGLTEKFVHLAGTSDKSALLLWMQVYGPNQKNAFISKVTLNGDFLRWKRIDTDPGYVWSTRGILALLDGTSILLGSHDNHGTLIRCDADLAPIIARRIDLSGSFVNGIAMTDSTFLLFGLSANAASLATCDLEGTVLSASSFGEEFGGVFTQGIRAHDGGTVIAGHAGSLVKGGGGGALICRTDSSGTVLWTRRLWAASGASSSIARIHGIMESPSGEIRLAAWYIASWDARPQVAMLALSANGELEWCHRLTLLPYDSTWWEVKDLVSRTDSVMVLVGKDYGPDNNSSEGGSTLAALDINDSVLLCTRSPRSWALQDGLVNAQGDLMTSAFKCCFDEESDVAPMLVRPGPGLDICGSSSVSIGIEPLDMVVDSVWSTTPLSITSTDELSYFTFVDEIPSTLDPCQATITPDFELGSTASRIWPNPVVDVVHVQGVGIDHIHLVDAMGRSIRSEPRDHEISFDLDLHGLASGFYSVRILSGNCQESHALIKD